MVIVSEFDGTEARARRGEALDRALARFVVVQERFHRVYGMRLPQHLAYGAAFFLGLSQPEWQVCRVSLAGIGSWFREDEERPASLDERLHYRYRLDPPEFVTIASGDSDGSHWGLFYDLPSELPRIIAHGYARDDGAVWEAGTTLLAAIHDQFDGKHLDRDEQRRLRAVVGWLDALIVKEREVHAEEQIGEPYKDRIDSNGLGIGPYLPGFKLPIGMRTTETRIRGLEQRSEDCERWLELARAELAAGNGALALALGRELFLLDKDATRDIAIELLAGGYTALDRGALAEIARLHHEHRDLPHVDVYGVREPPPELPPLVAAVKSGDLDVVEEVLATKPPLEDVAHAMLYTPDNALTDDMRTIVERLLAYGGADAASHAFGNKLIRIRAIVPPDLLAKAARAGADQTRSTLEYMLKKDDRAFVDLLLAHGAKPSSSSDVENAVSTGELDLVEHALAHAPPGFDEKALRTDYTLDGVDRPNGGATLLHLAVLTANVDLVRFLVARGLDLDAKDAAGQTPRDLARELWTIRQREATMMLEMFGLPAQPPAPPAKPTWEAGVKVTHAKFGEGTVTSVIATGGEPKLNVKFESGDKILLAKFLTRV